MITSLSVKHVDPSRHVKIAPSKSSQSAERSFQLTQLCLTLCDIESY